MNTGTSFTPQFQTTEKIDPLVAIRELAYRLYLIAAEPDAWKQYQYTNESRDVVLDRLQNSIDTYALEAQKELQTLTERNQGNIMRALKAETNVATLRSLAVDAQWLINAYGLSDALPAPSPIAHWLQRANAALEDISDLKGE